MACSLPCMLVLATVMSADVGYIQANVQATCTEEVLCCLPAVPVRTVGEQSYRIKEFRLRFYHCSTMRQPPQTVGMCHL